jgi:hypothetical protein
MKCGAVQKRVLQTKTIRTIPSLYKAHACSRNKDKVRPSGAFLPLSRDQLCSHKEGKGRPQGCSGHRTGDVELLHEIRTVSLAMAMKPHTGHRAQICCLKKTAAFRATGHHKSLISLNNGDPDRNRTCNLLIRNQLLYPVELRDQILCANKSAQRIAVKLVGLTKTGKDA